MPPSASEKLRYWMQNYQCQLIGAVNESDGGVKNKVGLRTFCFGNSKVLSTTFSGAKFIVPLEKASQYLDDGANKVDAYYLPCKINDVSSLRLGDDSDLFITDSLTGCAFVVVQNSDGQFVAHHINMQDSNGKIDEEAIDMKINSLSSSGDKIVMRLTKKDYETQCYAPITLIGERTYENMWTFYYQLSEKGKGVECHEVVCQSGEPEYCVIQ